MTPRERAIESLTDLNVELLGSTYDDLSEEGAKQVVEFLESAGLAIVDAEVHRLCVEAVRAKARWEDARAKYGAAFAANSDEQRDLEREFDRHGDLAVDTMTRAIAALEKSGE